MTDAPAPSAEALQEALRFAYMAVDFAYQQGLHEVGYDPIDRIVEALTAERERVKALEAEFDQLSGCFDDERARATAAETQVKKMREALEKAALELEALGQHGSAKKARAPLKAEV